MRLRLELCLLALVALLALLACGKENPTATAACTATKNSSACNSCCRANGTNGHVWSSGKCSCRGGN